MGAADSVQATLAGAKDTLAKAQKFTESAEGNPTSAFAPKKPEVPKIPQAKRPQDAPYSLAASLKVRRENVEQYAKAPKQ